MEAKAEEQTSVLRKAYRTLRMQTEQLKRRNEESIDMLGTVVEYRNLESGEHIQRVKGYIRILAECAMRNPDGIPREDPWIRCRYQCSAKSEI